MTDHPTPAHADDEIDLLDLLVTIAESWKLLVFVPLLVGALTATVTTFFKPSYQSTAIVRLHWWKSNVAWRCSWASPSDNRWVPGFNERDTPTF